jgi:hypothetical protein
LCPLEKKRQPDGPCGFGGIRKWGGLCAVSRRSKAAGWFVYHITGEIRKWGDQCVVSTRNKAAGWFVYHITGEIRQQDDFGEIRRWRGWCIVSIRNKAAGWFGYRVTGEVRQQDDLGIVCITEIRLQGGLGTTSFGEWVDLLEQDPSVGAGLTLRPQCSQRVGAPGQGQQLSIRLFLVHHLDFMVERKEKNH